MLLFFFVVNALLLQAYAAHKNYAVNTTTVPRPPGVTNPTKKPLNLDSIQSNASLCNLEEKAIGKRFSLHQEPLTWFGALEVCRREGGQLAVPRSPQEAKALGALLFKTPIPTGEVVGEALHVGIQNIAETDIWRTLDGSRLSEAGYDLWMEGGEGYCGALLSDGRYLKQPCYSRMRFACEKPNYLAVREASDYVEVGDAGRFRLYEEPLPWALALRRCQEEGASLAVPASAREAGLLAGVLFTRAASNPLVQRNGFFVGITDVAQEGHWRTLTGIPLVDAGYESWARSHPLGNRRVNCGALQKDGRYADYPCLSSMAYVCQENIPSRDEVEDVVTLGIYRLHKKPLSWFEALRACQHENATLVAATSNERSNVLELMKGRERETIPSHHGLYYGNQDHFEIRMIHVSIYKLNTTWEYISEDKTPLNYRTGHEPTYNDYDDPHSSEETLNVHHEHDYSNCAGIKFNGLYYMVSCSRILPYVCKHG